MIENKNIKKYFEINASTWVDDNYTEQPYTYPVPMNRNRIAFEVIGENLDGGAINLLDIGCGGGNFCLEAFKNGYNVTGIDQSEKMISIAQERMKDSKANVQLIHSNILEANFRPNQFDVIVALGLIEYLEDEYKFWHNIHKWLKPGGIFIADFRNRLFNMISISDYTKREIKNNKALELIDEIEELYSSLDDEDVKNFFSRLLATSTYLNNFWKDKQQLKPDPADKSLQYKGTVEGTQHTPRQTANTGKKFGLLNICNYGVHPHLLLPKFNKLLPPQAFNLISDTLLPFEKSPISLLWSSKYIGVFKKVQS